MLAMCSLADFLEQSGKSQATAAGELGIHKTTINKLLSGERTPSLPLAIAIERWSDGKVRATSWGEGEAKCA